MESLLVLNPKPFSRGCSPLKQKKAAACSLPRRGAHLRFDPLQGFGGCYRISFVAATLPSNGSLSPRRRCSLSRRVVAFAASHEESHSEIEVDEDGKGLNFDAKKSQEIWEQALNSFKEKGLKMQSISKDAYEEFSKKALVALDEISKQLKIQADKAKEDLNLIVQEISEEGKEYVFVVAENYPEEVKEIVETFTSPTDDLNEISKIQDFYFGIPYGLVLSLGGFLSFMLTGSLAAIRFGVILGGSLLALSILSLRSYKRGQSFPLALKGQAVIAAIISFREWRLLLQRPSFVSLLTTLISATVVALYVYRIVLNARNKSGKNLETE